MLLTFSYFTGWDLFHKIALTSKQVREMLRNSGLLNQDKVITARGPEFEPPLNSFIYAIELSNAIQIQVPSLDHLDYVKSFFNTMQTAA
jgi:hypothetical protein